MPPLRGNTQKNNAPGRENREILLIFHCGYFLNEKKITTRRFKVRFIVFERLRSVKTGNKEVLYG